MVSAIGNGPYSKMVTAKLVKKLRTTHPPIGDPHKTCKVLLYGGRQETATGISTFLLQKNILKIIIFYSIFI